MPTNVMIPRSERVHAGPALFLTLFVSMGCGGDGDAFQPEAATRALDAALATSVLDENGQPCRNAAMRIESRVFSYEGAAGISREDSRTPMTADTPFVIASIGKTMTATVILQMWEEGLLGSRGLDVPLADLGVLPADVIQRLHVMEGESRGDEITIRHLLSHSSGMKDVMEDDAGGTADDYPEYGTAPGSINGVTIHDAEHGYLAYAECVERGDRCDPAGYYPFHRWTPWDEAAWRADPGDGMAGLLNFYLASGMNETALFAPGEGFHYTDTSFIVLGLVIERLSGHPLHQELRSRIFDPLGMRSTYLHDAVQPPASPWEGVSDYWTMGVPVLSSGVDISMDWGAGGEVSTLGDLSLFLRALAKGSLFRHPETMEEMTSYSSPLGDRFGYGLGLLIEHVPGGGRILFHTGAPASWMAYFTKEDVLWVGTINEEGDDDMRLEGIFAAVYEVMREAGVQLPPWTGAE